MKIRGFRGITAVAATGLVLFGAAFVLTSHFSASGQTQDGITIVPVLKSSKYPILLPTATSKATIDVKAPAVSPKTQAFPRQI